MMLSSRLLILTRSRPQIFVSRVLQKSNVCLRNFSSSSSSSSPDNTSPLVSNVVITQSKAAPIDDKISLQTNNEKEKVVVEACGDLDEEDDEMEEEEMFVDAHPSFEHQLPEWGGPRRGGRFPEPTRYGDWERKGRCTDF